MGKTQRRIMPNAASQLWALGMVAMEALAKVGLLIPGVLRVFPLGRRFRGENDQGHQAAPNGIS